ncbi:hypothetical protein D3C87_2066910 [compost metagenome]
MVYTFGVDELHPGGPDFLVRAGPVFDWGVRFERSANGRTLLELFRKMLFNSFAGAIPNEAPETAADGNV